MLLTYAINMDPNPLTEGTANGLLTLIATNGTGAPVTIRGINIGMPTGTDADALTTVPAQIGPTPPHGWKMGSSKQLPGLYTFVFTPPNNPAAITIQPGRSLVFVLTDIAVNGTAGTTKVIVTEGSDEFPTLKIPLSKFPVGWGDVTFIARPANFINGGHVTLHWDGPTGTGAVYTIQYYDPATQQIITIPAEGDPPLSNSGTIRGLNISATTVFTLWVNATISGIQYFTEVQQTVTVGPVPAITSFTGTITGTGDNRKLNLTWETTNAGSVEGSWTSNLQAPNHTTAIIDPPFKQSYSITAINGTLPGEPAYLYMSLAVNPQTIAAGNNPFAIAITPDSMYAFVVNITNPDSQPGTVSVIDVNTLAVKKTITVGNLGMNLGGIAITSDNMYAFVTGGGYGTVSVIDVSTLAVTQTITINLGISVSPQGIAITPDNKYAFVINRFVGGNAGTVSVIDINTLTVTQTITVGANPVAIAITVDYAFVLNFFYDTVSVIDVSTLAVKKTITVGYSPSAIAITADNQFVFVTNSNNGTVSVIDVSTLAVIQTITVGANPFAIAITPNGQFALVAYVISNTVSVIDVSTLAVMETITVGFWPGSIAITADGNYVFVANKNDNTVSVLCWGLPAE